MFCRNISVFLFVLSSFLTASATSMGPPNQSETCKIKVDISEIFLSVDGMYYKPSNGPLTKVTSLEYENGSYVVSAPKGILDDVFGVWYCYNCQNYNSKYDANCNYCGKPR